MGNNSTIIDAEIGKFCSIADNVIIGGGSHPVTWVSTSPVFHKGKNILGKNFSIHEYKAFERTTIGNDVWIGSDCLIKSGIQISNGAIIGMGAVVTKNVGPYEIWGGVPARKIATRFDKEYIDKINNLEWWNWSVNEIEIKSKFFNDPKSLLKECDLS